MVNRMRHNHKRTFFIHFSNQIMNTSLNSAFVRCTEDKKRRHTQIQSDAKKRELLKNPTKIEEIQEKKFIDRN